MLSYDLTKRLLDIALALMLIIVLSPLLLLVALLVRLQLGKPIFFRQERPGLQGKPFFLIKFRSMTDGRNVWGELLPDSERLTVLGKFLRSTSLDEIPGLFNVLRGDLSFVGPRPLLMRYLERYTSEQMRRHEVKPGITGWAQVNGRNALSWEEKFEFDLWYIEHRSLWLDCKIMWMTLRKVIWREGISQPGHVTMEEFRGSKERAAL